MYKKENSKLKNPIYTENLLMCSSILCGCLSRVFLDDPELKSRLNSVLPAHKALMSSIERITEDDSEVVDENQLILEL